MGSIPATPKQLWWGHLGADSITLTWGLELRTVDQAGLHRKCGCSSPNPGCPHSRWRVEVDWVIQCFLASVTPGKCTHMRRTSWTFKEPLSCYAMLSSFSHAQLLAIPHIVACQGPLPMGFSRQEYWSGLPCPPPGDLLNPGIKPTSLTSSVLASRFITTSTTWEAWKSLRLRPKSFHFL